MRVLFAGGGTAGHINPALAAAGYLRSKQPDAEILYVGNKGGMEERLVPAAGFDFKTIRISGFQRKLTAKNIRRNIKTVFRLFSSSVESERIIKAFKPDICVGTGGYVSGPVIRAAQKLGIPTVIHEQNAYPGMTTKALAKHAECVMLAVEDAKKYLDRKDNCVFTGNPVRVSVLQAEREAARKARELTRRSTIARLCCRSAAVSAQRRSIKPRHTCSVKAPKRRNISTSTATASTMKNSSTKCTQRV